VIGQHGRMTSNAFDDLPDDFDRGACEWSGRDWLDDDDGSTDQDDDFEIEIALDTKSGRLLCIYTSGLSWFGVPELYVMPPAEVVTDGAHEQSELTVFLATGLAHLGQGLLDSDDAELPPCTSEYAGRPVSVWLAREEVPEGPLRVALPGARSVVRVECSLWLAAPEVKER
jgi:hypothetical protein